MKLRWILAYAALHFVVLMAAIVLSLGGLPGMDEAAWAPSLVNRFSEAVVVVLGQPMMLVWVLIGGGAKFTDGLEWAMFLTNSLAWGIALAFLHGKWRALRVARATRTAGSTQAT